MVRNGCLCCGPQWLEEWELADSAEDSHDRHGPGPLTGEEVPFAAPCSSVVIAEVSQVAAVLEEAMAAATGARQPRLYAMSGVALALVQQTIKEGGDAHAAVVQALPVLRAYHARLRQLPTAANVVGAARSTSAPTAAATGPSAELPNGS